MYVHAIALVSLVLGATWMDTTLYRLLLSIFIGIESSYVYDRVHREFSVFIVFLNPIRTFLSHVRPAA